MGSVYTIVFANVILLPAKRALLIQDVRQGENDRFTRNKALIITLSTTVMISAHLGYYAYYIASTYTPLFNPAVAVPLWSIYFITLSIGLNLASRYEYSVQIRELEEIMARLLDDQNGQSSQSVHLLYFDEVGGFADLFNQFLAKFRGLLNKIDSSASVLSASVHELSTTTKEVTSTSNMQAAAVKEVVSTMEDSNTITQSVGKSISEVTRIAMRTKEHVDSGTGIVEETTSKMNEIRRKNTDTISGIRSLTDKIRAIWEIVDIINAIVEQTRIIAFNAALEASTAGEAGRNFRVVAGEIKRLADSTSQSTAEIQTRITEIQKAANNLIVVSEEGTERIRQGHELSDRLHEVFSEILSSADISVTSSESIEHSIRQQVNAFEQILITMKEISRGIDNLVSTQQQTAKTADALSGMAVSLKSQAGQFTAAVAGEEA
ncbi:MAG TPA: methyl-accepting chemotaxis protein, partial [Spirochaetales bacterium]|nr:methyl-accepting chemotaxis protein [Spirochaetales bacterium]